ncbi:MAG: hypothetical protein AMK72_15020, partial [Planctomycetes bacterium SM23_25]
PIVMRQGGLPKLRIVGLDGFSERLRRMVNKPISRGMLRAFFSGLGSSKVPPNRVKVYNIFGYPTETEDDWSEFVEDRGGNGRAAGFSRSTARTQGEGGR